MKNLFFLIAVLFCTAANSQTVITGPGDTLQINVRLPFKQIGSKKFELSAVDASATTPGYLSAAMFGQVVQMGVDVKKVMDTNAIQSGLIAAVRTVNVTQDGQLTQLGNRITAVENNTTPGTGIIPFYPAIIKTGTSFTLTDTCDNRAIRFTSDSPVFVYVPAGMKDGFRCVLYQGGKGTVTVIGVNGAQLISRLGYYKTDRKYARIEVWHVGEKIFHLDGNMKY